MRQPGFAGRFHTIEVTIHENGPAQHVAGHSQVGYIETQRISFAGIGRVLIAEVLPHALRGVVAGKQVVEGLVHPNVEAGVHQVPGGVVQFQFRAAEEIPVVHVRHRHRPVGQAATGAVQVAHDPGWCVQLRLCDLHAHITGAAIRIPHHERVLITTAKARDRENRVTEVVSSGDLFAVGIGGRPGKEVLDHPEHAPTRTRTIGKSILCRIAPVAERQPRVVAHGVGLLCLVQVPVHHGHRVVACGEPGVQGSGGPVAPGVGIGWYAPGGLHFERPVRQLAVLVLRGDQVDGDDGWGLRHRPGRCAEEQQEQHRQVKAVPARDPVEHLSVGSVGTR